MAANLLHLVAASIVVSVRRDESTASLVIFNVQPRFIVVLPNIRDAIIQVYYSAYGGEDGAS